MDEESEKEKFETILDRVQDLLKRYPACRNNDNYLVLLYWWAYHPEFRKALKRFIDYNTAKKLTPAETIRRARQKIQNEFGMYPPTDPDVIKRRRIKEKIWRKMLPRV